MISSVFTLKESNNIHYDLSSVKETVLEENYYTNSTYKFLLETHEELLLCRQNFYKTVLSEDTDYMINESFTDVINKVKEIIKKILAYIESLIKRFVTQLNKFIKSDKYILKRKDDIRKFPDDESFDINGYEYTTTDNVPVVDIEKLDFLVIKDAIKKAKVDDVSTTIENINAIITEYTSESELEKACGQILGLDENVPETSFDNKAFAVFRDGESSERDITIEKKQVIEALYDFDGYDKKIKQIKSLENTIKNKYKTLESQINSIIEENLKTDGSSTIELKNVINNLVNTLVNQIQKISTLHTRAVAIKLDAYNSQVLQERNILYRALNIVQKDIKNSKFMKEQLDLSIPQYTHDYVRDLNARQFMIELYDMNIRQQRFVKECLALSENNISKLKAINEDLKMDVKGKFQKLIDFIKQLYQKFLMKINEFITNDEGFLKKYKDIILNKKIDTVKINDMPNYKEGIKNITETQIPHIDLKALEGKDENQIQKEVLKSFDGSKEYAEFAKEYFLCGNQPRKDIELNFDGKDELSMAEIYNFCVDAKTTVKRLEADRDKYINETNSISNAVIAGISVKESTGIYGRKYYYSSVLESYITEDDDKQDTNNYSLKLDPDKNQQEEKEKDTNKDVKDKAAKFDNDKARENQKDDYKDSAKDDKEAKEKKEKLEQVAKWYLDSLRVVCGAKITAFQQIYKDYMSILRNHVKKATGSMGSSSKFTSDEVKRIREVMKKYKDAETSKDDNSKNSARDELISIYKSRDIKITAQDVQNLVAKNANALTDKK